MHALGIGGTPRVTIDYNRKGTTTFVRTIKLTFCVNGNAITLFFKSIRVVFNTERSFPIRYCEVIGTITNA